MPNRQLGNLIVEIHETFHDHLTRSSTSSFLGVLPSTIDILFLTNHALSVSARAHDRLHHARHTDYLHRFFEFLLGLGETIRRGRQAQLLGRQAADSLTVHRQPSGTGGRNHMVSLFLQFHQGTGSDRLHLRHDIIRFLFLDDLPQGIAIQHGDHIGTMRHLHGRSVRILIQGDYLHAITLQLYYKLFPQFARATKHDFSCRSRFGRTNCYHKSFCYLNFAAKLRVYACIA